MQNVFDQYMMRYKAGDVVFRDGETGEEMYIVNSGAVEVVKEIDGRRTVLSRLEKGDFFGEMAILEALPRSATVEVVEDAVLIKINKATFETLLKSNIEIAIRMLRKYSIRLREANMEIERLHARSRKGAKLRITAKGPTAGMPVGADVSEAPPKPPEPGPAREPEPASAVAGEAPAAAPRGTLAMKDSGKSYPLTLVETTVGRKDPVTGAHPDIDLSGEDMVRSVSRRHAKLVARDGAFFIMEEVGVANGTFLNGERLATGDLRPLKDGDELKFGLVAAHFKLGAA